MSINRRGRLSDHDYEQMAEYLKDHASAERPMTAEELGRKCGYRDVHHWSHSIRQGIIIAGFETYSVNLKDYLKDTPEQTTLDSIRINAKGNLIIPQAILQEFRDSSGTQRFDTGDVFAIETMGDGPDKSIILTWKGKDPDYTLNSA